MAFASIKPLLFLMCSQGNLWTELSTWIFGFENWFQVFFFYTIVNENNFGLEEQQSWGSLETSTWLAYHGGLANQQSLLALSWFKRVQLFCSRVFAFLTDYKLKYRKTIRWNGFDWVWLGLTGFFRVWLGFTGFLIRHTLDTALTWRIGCR